MDNVVVAFVQEENRRHVRRMLESGGFRTSGCSSGGEAIRAARTQGAGAVICGFRLGDMTANRLAADLRGGAAVLVLSSAANLDLCEGENLYKLASPVSRTELFALLEMLLRRAKRPPPRRDAGEQRLIQRAKELLMDVNRMSEAEAHRFLQKYSMDRGWKLAETAQWVLDSYTR